MSSQQPTVSVIFPTLNEAENLPLVFSHLPLALIDEVILVDGRSTDGTIEVARQLLPEIKIVLEPAPGKGAAMRAGYREASGDILVVIDADGSNDPRELPRFVKALLEGADFAKGSRFAPHGGTSDMPRIRKMGNATFVRIVNLLFASTFTDLCYGYHAFWRYCLDSIDLEGVDGFEIDTALYLRALRDRLRITEVPSFEGYRFYGLGKLQTIPDGWRVLRTIVREWWAALNTPPREAHLGFRGSRPLGAEAVQQAAGGLPALSTTSTEAQLAAPLEVPAAEQARATLQLLQSACRLLTVELNVRSLLQKMLRLTLESVRAASGSIVLMNDSGKVVDGFLAFQGEVRNLGTGGALETVERGLAGWVVEHRRPALVADTYEDPRWLCRSWEKRESQSRSAVGVPLVADDRVVGVLTLVRPHAGQFTEDDLAVLSSIAASVPNWRSNPEPRHGNGSGNGHHPTNGPQTDPSGFQDAAWTRFN